MEKDIGRDKMGTYVVGDIHGCLDEWLELKNKIESQDPEAKFILLGDIVDRGPKVYETLQWAMQNITYDGKYQLIRGNHEEMKIDWWKGMVLRHNDRNEINIPSSILGKSNLAYQQIEEIINFFKSLPIYKEFDINISENRKKHFIIVHGGIRYNCLTEAETIRTDALKPYNTNSGFVTREALKNKSEMLWSRNNWGYSLLKKSIIVHGHTPTIDMEVIESGAVPGRIHFTDNSINVDCGLVFRDRMAYGNLGAIRLEDFTEFYVYDDNIDEEAKADLVENIKINAERKQQMFKGRAGKRMITLEEDKVAALEFLFED